MGICKKSTWVKSIETLFIALYVNGGNVTYCNSFRVEYIPKYMKRV